MNKLTLSISFLCCFVLASSAKEIEKKLLVDVSNNVTIKFSYIEVNSDTYEISMYDISFYEDRIYYSFSHPPKNYLTSCQITIGDEVYSVDVQGLANVWHDPKEFNKNQIFLEQLNVEKDSNKNNYYMLTILFLSGGACDYSVTWYLHKGKSLRVSIQSLGDEYPDWYNPGELKNKE